MNKFILIITILVAMAKIANAHPPGEIIAQFDTTNKILKLTVNHQVRDSQKHYVNKIEIELNGNRIIEQKSGRQIDNAIQKYLFILPEAKIEDIITIEAYCNISGKKKLTSQIGQLPKESVE
ncbi:MAG: hypothetical protein ABIL20_08380 [candidate division WOR-3 bacterium]